MAWVLDQCLILMHPFMPFITEALWRPTGARAKLLAHADWPTYGAELVDPAADAEMNWVIALIEGVRSVRAQMHVPAGLDVPVVMVEADAPARAALARNARADPAPRPDRGAGRGRGPARRDHRARRRARPSRCRSPGSSTSPPRAPA